PNEPTAPSSPENASTTPTSGTDRHPKSDSPACKVNGIGINRGCFSWPCRRPRRRVLTQRSHRVSQLAVESSWNAERPITVSHPRADETEPYPTSQGRSQLRNASSKTHL